MSTDLAKELEENGFCLVPKALDSTVIERLAELAAKRLAVAEGEHLSRYAHHGSLLPLTIEDHPVPEILTSDVLRGTFAALGFTDPRWISGYVIAKPPRSPGLWWHQDWWAWGHPRTYVRQPTQIFIMIYLEPTSRRNGCLRVIPGTHLKRHRLHDVLETPHTVEIEAAAHDSVNHREVDGEIDIEASPGDLVIGDVRVIHATHSNETDAMRTAIDLLFIPHFGTLPDEFKAHYINQICLPPAGWWEDPGHPLQGTAVGAMLPTYSGPEVGPVEFCRRPRWPAGWQSGLTT
ncbi:phytanoyl-CoA dioxygenase family protein [Sphaerisporangium album]|uniref:phytanoyl-CoA dioxygenase family protein n=1 Tax=Sphaerisporangium album TaxID=509200 RepID=UPI0015F10EBC|nr:phytanoyl-CoA dioxygenase family protein [Sphaerisporangium album]